MFYAMGFYPTGFNSRTVVRAIRVKPFKSLNEAVKAITNKKIEGYVKQVGHNKPVWNNLQI